MVRCQGKRLINLRLLHIPSDIFYFINKFQENQLNLPHLCQFHISISFILSNFITENIHFFLIQKKYLGSLKSHSQYITYFKLIIN
jgi:hypothetical protein